jgi:hypothetical protein
MAYVLENLNVYRGAMNKCWRLAVKRGRTPAGTTPEQFFGFRVIDIACMHRHLAGEGCGIWFRLDDGRVVDSQGEPAISDPSLYDVRIH